MTLPTDLNRLAQIVLGTLSPGAGRLFSPVVRVGGDTACTNTVWIQLPEVFARADLHQRPDLAVGLLAHELGHWLQPLAETDEVVEALRFDSWVYNLLLDIQGEAMISTAFPPILGPLEACRKQMAGVETVRLYQRFANTCTTFMQAVRAQAGVYRFHGAQPYWHVGSPRLSFPQLNADALRVLACCCAFCDFLSVKAEDLPKAIHNLACNFPELCERETTAGSGGQSGQSGQPEDHESNDADGEGQDKSSSASDEENNSAGEGSKKPGAAEETNDSEGASSGSPAPGQGSSDQDDPYAVRSGGAGLDDLQSILRQQKVDPQLGIAKAIASMEEDCRAVGKAEQQKTLEVQRVAAKLVIHFKTPKGSMEIPAPERLNLHAAIRQDPCPFRMDMPSRLSKRPLPKVVLALDHSGSMNGSKWEMAHAAAQAITLAVRNAGGDVRVLLFDARAWHLPEYDPAILEAAEAVKGSSKITVPHPDGGTTFMWLPQVWAAFPDHLVILLTDGEADEPPFISKAGRSRTSAVVIPDGKPDQAAIVAERVVVINDLNGLPGAFTSLIPRQWVA